jgi:hypothetical protein
MFSFENFRHLLFIPLTLLCESVKDGIANLKIKKRQRFMQCQRNTFRQILLESIVFASSGQYYLFTIAVSADFQLPPKRKFSQFFLGHGNFRSVIDCLVDLQRTAKPFLLELKQRIKAEGRVPLLNSFGKTSVGS